MKKYIWVLVAFVLLAVVVAVMFVTCKRNQDSAMLTGKVVDSNKLKPVDKATVKVGDIKTTTDKDGQFRLEGIQVGRASIFVIADGFKPFEFSGYDFKAGQNTIEELIITGEEKTAVNPDISKPIPQPPMPGTKLDKVPPFKMLDKFTNCIVTLSVGDAQAGNAMFNRFTFNNGICKMEILSLGRQTDPNAGSPDVYITDKLMIMNPSKQLGWVSQEKPPVDPKFGDVSPDNMPMNLYKAIYINLTDKAAMVTSGGKTKIDGIEYYKYFVVSDSNENLIDGEIYTPVSGKYKDYVVKYSGRLSVGGDSDRKNITITNIDSAPTISLPKNIKPMPKPPTQQPIAKPAQPQTDPKQNP